MRDQSPLKGHLQSKRALFESPEKIFMQIVASGAYDPPAKHLSLFGKQTESAKLPSYSVPHLLGYP